MAKSKEPPPETPPPTAASPEPVSPSPEPVPPPVSEPAPVVVTMADFAPTRCIVRFPKTLIPEQTITVSAETPAAERDKLAIDTAKNKLGIWHPPVAAVVDWIG